MVLMMQKILKRQKTSKRRMILKMHKTLKKAWLPSFSAKMNGLWKKVMSCAYWMRFWKKIC